MANEVIQLDANDLAQKIINKLSTETVGEVINRLLRSNLPKEEDLKRAFEWAVYEVSKEYFLNYLKNDAQFIAKLKKEIEAQLTAQMVKSAAPIRGLRAASIVAGIASSRHGNWPSGYGSISLQKNVTSSGSRENLK